MKPSKVINAGFRNLFAIKKAWLFTGLYSIIVLLSLLILARKGEWTHFGIFDIVATINGIMAARTRTCLCF